MIYSDLYTGRKQKIPTILGLFFILFIIIFFFAIINGSAVPSKADLAGLKRTEVTNLSPIQISIYWQTQNKETGWLVYGGNQERLTNIVLDDRDIPEKKGAYLNHYVTIRNLKPDSLYFYAIISSNKRIVKPDGSLFSFRTPKTISNLTKLSPSSGKVLHANLSPLSNAIVLLTVNNEVNPISTMTKENGEWLIPLNSFFDKEHQNEKVFSGKETAKIEVLSEDGNISTVTNSLEGLSGSTETIIIGKNYDYLHTDNVLSATTKSVVEPIKQSIAIIYPLENSLIPGRRPLIKGVALPSAKIAITINSDKSYSALITADRSGNWSYMIPEDLDIGNHVIFIRTKNIQGGDVVLSRRFRIVANEGMDGRVLGTASGEPTVTIKPTDKAEPTPTTYIYVSPTANPTITPSLLKSGVSDIFPIISGIAFIIVGGGILLAL